MLKSSLTRQSRTFGEVARSLSDFDPIASHSSTHLFKKFAGSYETVNALGESLGRIAQTEFGCALRFPDPPPAGADVAAGKLGVPVEALKDRVDTYVDALDQVVRSCPYFGTVKYLDRRTVLFTFCDATKRTGLFEHSWEVTEHRHEVVDAHEGRLDDPAVVLPRKQQRLIKMLPPAVLPHVRVIRGMLVQVSQQEAGTERREHALGRGLRGTGRVARQYGPTVAKGALATGAAAGIVAGLWALGTAIATAVTAPTAVAIGTVAVVALADPALVIGDLAISGWLESANRRRRCSSRLRRRRRSSSRCCQRHSDRPRPKSSSRNASRFGRDRNARD